MRVIRNFQYCPEFAKNSVIAIGNFDGIHKGHQKIISAAKEIASKEKTKSAIMTFEPHPAKVFGNLKTHPRLTPFAEKARILKDMGIDFIFCIRFNKEFAETSADDFVNKIIKKYLGAKHIVVGSDFTFGKNKAGTGEFLKEASRKNGVGVSVIETIGENKIKYSSSNIKTLLKDGKIEQANNELGRNHKISGKVIRGDSRGNKIGFPTANINLKTFVQPKYGVYAVKAYVLGKTYEAVANVGIKPTFSGTKPLLEVNIFGLNKDIYCEKISIEFFHFLRDEKKFEGVEELKKQISKDVEDAKNFFKRNI